MTEEEMRDLVAEAVTRATQDVCSTMLGFHIKAGTPMQIQHPMREGSGVISLIGLAGPWMGTGALCCSPELARRMAGGLLMTSYKEVNEEVLDCVAEITNIIVGNLKTAMEERVGSMGLSTPTVIYGASLSTKIGGSSWWTLIPFTADEDVLTVQVCVVPNTGNRLDAMAQYIGRHGHVLNR